MTYQISNIERVWPNWYQKDSQLSYDDQRWIWENVPLPHGYEQRLKEPRTNIDSVNGSVIGGRKLSGNFDENISKLQANTKLNKTNWKTPAKEIAFYLEFLFGKWDKKPKHWLYIAQHYTPKTIKSVRAQMVKSYQRGDASIQIPGAYFTAVIKHKRKRKIFRDTTGGRKSYEETQNV